MQTAPISYVLLINNHELQKMDKFIEFLLKIIIQLLMSASVEEFTWQVPRPTCKFWPTYLSGSEPGTYSLRA